MRPLTQRLQALDVFRGLTIIGMILVNTAGSSHTYGILMHAPWHGCTLADLIFPFFIFSMGTSLVFSLSNQKAREIPVNKIIQKVIKRSIIIFILGLLINGFPTYDLSSIRIMGVLQRIALCYLIMSLLFLKTQVKTQICIVTFILIGYWLVMMYIPFPGSMMGHLFKDNNLAAYVDKLLLQGHMYHTTYDPEGLLSTLPAIATGIIGTLAGIWLISNFHLYEKVSKMTIVGLFALTLGWLWDSWFPINKILWSSSYVLWTAGYALCILAIFYYLVEAKHMLCKPLEIFGTNALAAYVLHELFLKLQEQIYLTQNGQSINLIHYFLHTIFGWMTIQNASLLFACLYTFLWYVVFYLLYRYKIFIKI